MNKANLEIDLVAAQLDESVFTRNMQERGIRFRELSGNQKKVWKNHQLFRKLLRERNYDVVHLNMFQGMTMYYAHLAKLAGVPVRIAHSHNTDLRQSKTRAIKLWLHHTFSKRFAADATDFWACSENAAKFMFPKETLEAKGFTFIPNGIRTERFRFDVATRACIRKELGLEHEFVVGNVGRLCYQKNQEFLLDVFEQLLKERPDSRLLLVGEGESREFLEEKAKTLGIHEKVLFYGVSDSVERLFWAMDVFAFPSRFEGLGIVAVEAQTSGLPVVCSEFVPREAAVTKLAQTIELRAGSAVWAKALLKAGEYARHPEAQDAVRQAGFDIRNVAELVQRTYC